MKVWIGFFVCTALGKFFVISDLHYDLVYDENYGVKDHCKFSALFGEESGPFQSMDSPNSFRPYCDSSFSLIFETLSQMQAIEKDPDFILVLGDCIAHDTIKLLNEQGEHSLEFTITKTKESWKTIKSLFSEFFPHTKTLFSMGNNDGYFHYYLPEGPAKTDLFQFLFELWEIDPAEYEVFLQGGYFSSTFASYTFVSINSLYFTGRIEKTDSQASQFLWLRNTLKKSDFPVIITMHIPPTVSFYNGGSQMWLPEYSTAFLDILKEFSSKIAAVFCGHLHNGIFYVLENFPLIISPSVSPIYGNNPAVRLFDFSITSYEEFTFDLFSYPNLWYQSSFFQNFGFQLDFRKLLQNIENNEEEYEKFIRIATGWWVRKNFREEDMWKIMFGDIEHDTKKLKQIGICASKFILYNDFYQCAYTSESNLSFLG